MASVLLLAVMGAVPVHAQMDSTVTVPAETASSADAAIAHVRALEVQRQSAMVKPDLAVLQQIFAEDATYVHSNGLLQTRDELFRMLERGEIRYLSFQVERVSYRPYGNDTVVVSGVQRIQLSSSGKTFESYSRYTAVYAPVDGVVKLVSYQSTSMPEVAPSGNR
ncbi:MAG TPA: nuclear transport factor 2 family protein [Candidatus Krumholzibacteria bacterium]|nr:nuclear transport factor 2 family protein [Candidatus Krumholzibacteria bacterium]